MTDYTPAKFIIEYSPGKEELTETEECWSWPAVSIAFDNWLGFLEKELQIGDPWKNLKKFSAQVESMPATQENKAPASQSEQAVIHATLDEIKQLLLKQVADDQKKKQYLDERFQVLTDAATGFSKRDYLMLVYEAVIGIAVNIGTRPDVLSKIGTLLHELLAKLPQILAITSS
jgi:radical SAM superfamily enzyme